MYFKGDYLYDEFNFNSNPSSIELNERYLRDKQSCEDLKLNRIQRKKPDEYEKRSENGLKILCNYDFDGKS
jgi:hypothetical protein